MASISGALHQSAIKSPLSRTIPLQKEGAYIGPARDSVFLGVSLAEHGKQEFSLPAIGGKRTMNRNTHILKIRAQTVAAPVVTQESPDSKKTARKGNVIITGASSGLGLATAKALGESGKWHIIMACRDFLKAERAAKSVGIPKENYSVIHLDLSSLESVRQFVDNFRRSGRPLDVLVCNAAVYLPTAKEPRFTAEGFELSAGTNHLGHFLLSRLLIEDMKKSDYSSKRVIIVGSIAGNTNTLAGNVPPKANLGDLRGIAGAFDGAKAYKDSKVCNMVTMQEFHRRYHEETSITFASLYPGCIATTGLFREHIPLFRILFPPFQKYITKGYVSEEEAGQRLANQVYIGAGTKTELHLRISYQKKPVILRKLENCGKLVRSL